MSRVFCETWGFSVMSPKAETSPGSPQTYNPASVS
jgi:hypothetical protein